MLGILIGFIVGALLGQWANKIIYRKTITNREHCKGKKSECPSCGHILKWYEKLPIFSWLIIGGSCVQCKRPIRTREMLGELCTTASLMYIGYTVYEFIITVGSKISTDYIVYILDMIVSLLTVLTLCTIIICNTLKPIYDNDKTRVKELWIVSGVVGLGTILLLKVAQAIIGYEVSPVQYPLSGQIGRVIILIGILLTQAVLNNLLQDKDGIDQIWILTAVYMSIGLQGLLNVIIYTAVVALLMVPFIKIKNKGKGKVKAYTVWTVILISYIGASILPIFSFGF